MAGLLKERQSGVPESDAPKTVLRLPLEEAELAWESPFCF